MASSLENLAFIAGMYAFFNPCGIAMLPAYISSYIELGYKNNAEKIFRRIFEGLIIGISVSLGFLLLFGIVGAIISYLGTFILAVVPWLSILIGFLLVIFGLLWLSNKEIRFLSFLYKIDILGSRLRNAKTSNRY